MVGVTDGVVDRVGFTGRGCAISQASASLLTDEIKGKPLAEVAGIRADDLLDLLGIDISPARLKCAMLSHDSLQHVLADLGATPADPVRRPRRPPRPAHDRPDRAPLQVSPAGLSRHVTTGSTSDPSPSRPGVVPTSARRPSEPTSPMPKSYADLLREARAQIREVTIAGGRCPPRGCRGA